MVKQERAARTRESLIQAAGVAFDEAGFDGTSLGRVSAAAAISMGALTFHFRTKADLADAVQLRGLALTGEAVQRAVRGRKTPLDSVIAVTVRVVGLLEDSPAVRAAARLSRERTEGAASWPDSWVPVVEDLLARVPGHGLCPGTDPRVLLYLVSHLVSGAEVHIRSGLKSTDQQRTRPAAQVAEVWRLALRGISPAVHLPAPVKAEGRLNGRPEAARTGDDSDV
ncbi:TetR/AcrR family transcriptional regulator [Streptomyces sp. NPDC046831]|uniref:TetR/AcrR family transcriptional regulator n=1 Tax=Streptomyces sp. NPDC046831 TaxID=3154805 RepID=UPI0033F3E51B